MTERPSDEREVDELREARAELEELNREIVGWRLAAAGNADQAQADRDELSKLRAELAGIRDKQGTPLAISDTLWHFAVKECGHDPLSAKHALATVCETVAELRKDRDRLNWLERIGFSTVKDGRVAQCPGVHSWRSLSSDVWHWTAAWISSEYANVRAALDAAMEGK